MLSSARAIITGTIAGISIGTVYVSPNTCTSMVRFSCSCMNWSKFSIFPMVASSLITAKKGDIVSMPPCVALRRWFD